MTHFSSEAVAGVVCDFTKKKRHSRCFFINFMSFLKTAILYNIWLAVLAFILFDKNLSVGNWINNYYLFYGVKRKG